MAIPSLFLARCFRSSAYSLDYIQCRIVSKLWFDEVNLACIGRCSINEHLVTILFSFISSYFMSLKHVHGDVIQC